MNVEASAGAPPRAQARGQAAAMRTETATRTDWPTRRREGLAVAWPPDLDVVGRRVESAAREGLTVPEVLVLVLVALLALIGVGSMMLVLAII